MMSIFLDLVFVIVIIACAFRASTRTVYRNVANLLVLLAVFVGASIGTLALRPVVQSVFVQPVYARAVAADIADMVSTPVFDDPNKTVEALDILTLIEKQPEQFEQLIAPYNVESAAVLEAAQTVAPDDMSPSAAALKAIITPVSSDVAKLFTFGALFLILWLIFRAIAKQMYERRALGVKMTRNTAVSMALGVLTGVLWCYTLFATLIKCGYPYDFGIFALLNLRSGVDNSFVTRILTLINPF